MRKQMAGNLRKPGERLFHPRLRHTVRHFLSDNFRSSSRSVLGERAYLVQSPNLHTNENDTELEVVDLAIHRGATRRLLAEKRAIRN